MSFKVERYSNIAWSGTAATIITPSIDVSNFDKFSIQIENNNTATADTLIHIAVQGSNNPADSAANSAPNWVALNTTTYPIASALGATAALLTIPYNNAYKFIRFEVTRSATGAGLSAGTIIFSIAGFQRRDG